MAKGSINKSLCNIKDGVFLEEADDEDRTLIEEQARKEWSTFVVSRGRELKPGGYLVVVTPSCNEGNTSTCHIAGGPMQLGGLVRNMYKEGLITEDEYLNTNFNTHYLRTEVDFREPFTHSHSEVTGLGLEMVSVRGSKHYVHHPVYDIVDKDAKEKEQYAEHIVAGIRPWLYYVIYGGLNQSRTETEKQTIVEEYFNRVYRHAYSNSNHKPYMVVSEVVIRKSNH
ncbi:uncharacterized protein LOC132558673 [Ylistrum balloti]|uniref:uncharacterized protein LOC132558673 n=1 Tax=Ylistrum balloti TaxID=509963 RepID=UPI002905B818|nr:uncharacterized protein LOC132558673 [Ylistrum balloti]